MADYINRDQLQNALARKKSGPANGRYTEGWNDCLMRVKSMVSAAPSVEGVVQVVRCRDCRFCCTGVMGPWCSLSDGMLVISPDAFCSYGRRKEDTDD